MRWERTPLAASEQHKCNERPAATALDSFAMLHRAVALSMHAPATGFLVPGGQGLQAELWEAPVNGLVVPAGLQCSNKKRCSAFITWRYGKPWWPPLSCKPGSPLKARPTARPQQPKSTC
jgi:hypothetical protein